ncbi:MAG: hypothetical protein M3Q13_08640 [Pseudomonadota bacterium]|nr:hypothetical protein [Pseudomonadota bacterium]
MTSGGIAPVGMAFHLAGWLFGLLLLGIGIANLVLVHPVPALGYGLVSLVYLPPAGAALRDRFGVSVPVVVKVVLAMIVIMFTLGVSDLGDMID